MTTALTVWHRRVAVFLALEHCSAERVGIHTAMHGRRQEALQPIRQGKAAGSKIGLSRAGRLEALKSWH